MVDESPTLPFPAKVFVSGLFLVSLGIAAACIGLVFYLNTTYSNLASLTECQEKIIADLKKPNTNLSDIRQTSFCLSEASQNSDFVTTLNLLASESKSIDFNQRVILIDKAKLLSQQYHPISDSFSLYFGIIATDMILGLIIMIISAFLPENEL